MAKRRGNHEGSISRRPNGKWQAQISLQGKRLGKTFASKEGCRKWIIEMARQSERGLSYNATQLCLKDYLVDWLIAKKNNVRPNTHHQYNANIRNHILPTLGHIKLSEVTPVHLEQLYALMAAEGVGSRTRQVTHSLLNASLKRATQLGIISSNPASRAERPKSTTSTMSILNDYQVRELLIAAEGKRIEAIIFLAVTSGMRQGELLGLKWGDIDWGQSTLRIQRQLQRIKGNGGLRLGSPKTTRSERTIRLGNKMIDKLLDHQRLQSTISDYQVATNGLLFPNSRGNPLEPRRLYKEFKELLKQAGLPDIRFHELRHTAASLMLSSGMKLVEVSNQLGHSKVSTTLDVYAHLVPGLGADSVAALEDLVIPIAAELQQSSNSISDKAAIPEKSG